MNSRVMTVKKIAEEVGCSPSTARVYLGRPEFSHIKLGRLHQVIVYTGVLNRDLVRLYDLVNKRKLKTGRGLQNGKQSKV